LRVLHTFLLLLLLLDLRGFTGVPRLIPDDIVISSAHKGLQLGEKGLLGGGASCSKSNFALLSILWGE
jgi:hypothetical protein